MDLQEAIEELWNHLHQAELVVKEEEEDDDDIDDDNNNNQTNQKMRVVSEAVHDMRDKYDAYLLQEIFNTKHSDSRLLPTEFICSLLDCDVFNNASTTIICIDLLNVIIENGGEVTDDCYRNLLRKHPISSMNALYCLMDSGYFPTQLGNTYTLDWIIDSFLSMSSTNDDSNNDDHSMNDESSFREAEVNLEKSMLRLFEWKKQEKEMTMDNNRNTKMIVGEAYESGGEFETWIRERAMKNHCGLSFKEWYSKFQCLHLLTGEIEDEKTDQQQQTRATTPAVVRKSSSNSSVACRTPNSYANNTISTSETITEPRTKKSRCSLSPSMTNTTPSSFFGASYAVTPRISTVAGGVSRLSTVSPSAAIGTSNNIASRMMGVCSSKRPFITPTPSSKQKTKTLIDSNKKKKIQK